MSKTKAYSYLRISTEMQKSGDGTRRQIEASRKYAQENNYELVETISDMGVSAFKGKNAKEGAFSRFLAAIDDGRIEPGSVLIVESLDRLSREGAMVAFSQFSRILEKKIAIVTLMDGQVYSEESVKNNFGQLFMSLGIMMRANDESETKSRRLKAAWAKKRQEIEQKKLTKRAPAWLELNEDRTEFSVREEAADTIREIFDLCINGVGIYSIARHLNGDLKKYPAIGNAARWNSSYVAKILHNPAVFGRFQPNVVLEGKRTSSGDAIEDYYPPIVSEKKYLLAQSSLGRRRIKGAGRKGDSFSNLFTNLVVCGLCGGTMNFRDKGKPPKGGQYLRCHNSILNNGCDCPPWRYAGFEEAFYKFVQEVEFFEVLGDEKTKKRTAELQDEETVLDQRIEEASDKYDKLLERMDTLEISDAVFESLGKKAEGYSKDVLELKEIRKKVLSEINELNAEETEKDRVEFLNEYKRLDQSLSSKERKHLRFRLHSIIERSIDRITIFNGAKIYPWEAEEVISEELKRLLEEKGIKSEYDLENYFASEHGKRVYNHSERYFVVSFKNGTERTVRPFFESSLITVSDQLAKLRAGTSVTSNEV